MAPKTIDIVINPGVGVQGEAPDFPHLESPAGEIHTVGAQFGWTLVAENRARLANPGEEHPGLTGRIEAAEDTPGRRRR